MEQLNFLLFRELNNMSKKEPALRATFRHNVKNSKLIYNDSTVILLISPGQEYHEGEKFAATIDLINRSGFKECLIIIGDTNYRHTLKIIDASSDDVLYLKAQEVGEQWLTRNYKFLGQLQMNYKITRWASWFAHPTYEEHRKTVDYFYEHDLKFREAFLKSANEFVARIMERQNMIVSYEEAINASLEYLKEECAIIMPVWAELGFNIIIYPSNMLEAMEKTYETIVKPNMGDHLIWLPLRFKRKTERVLEEQRN